jgi:hypothetical protein
MEKNTCEICWDEVEPIDLFETGCKPVGHKFHIACIQFNYKTFNNKECPMCRKSLNINMNHFYPKCKYILTKGKNKGKNCSKKGKNDGYCEQHKIKVELEQNNPEETGVILINPKQVLQPKCEAITKKGTNCNNSAKITKEINGQTYHVCGIHKNWQKVDLLPVDIVEIIPQPILVT